MSKIKVTFNKCIQDSQHYGSNDEYMASRVFFTIDVNGEKYEDLYVDIKQAVSSDFGTGIIEISPIEGHKASIDCVAFRDGLEKYYRDSFVSPDEEFRILGKKIRLRDSIVLKKMTIEFEVSSTPSP